MKKVLLFIALILTSCSKEEIRIPEDSKIPEKFQTLSERYSAINETSGYFKSQEYSTTYLSKNYIRETLYIPFDGHSEWITFHKNTSISDFDGDQKQDIIAFATSFCDEHTYSFHKGKFIFISDYLGSAKKEVVESLYNFGTGDMIVNDYNGDGLNEVLFFATETKMNSYNEEENIGGTVNNPPLAPSVIYYQDGLKSKFIGLAGDSHTGASGDIDNDGDIDFIQWPIPSVYNFDPVKYNPTLQSNSANFSFTESKLISDLNKDWYATAIDLFDVNGDGYLDLLVGWRAGTVKWYEHTGSFHDSLSAPILLYGDGSGKYNLSNSTVLVENTLSSKNVTATVLGYGFTDYDNDGDIDILVTTTRDEPGGSFEDGTYYDNYYLILYKNNNGTFTDVTDSTIDVTFNQTREFTNFYKIRTIDVDNDGDYDIVPDAIANWGSIDYLSNMHWKNNQNKFNLSY